MPPRFDAENLVLELSVGDLVEASAARNLGFGQRGGYERMWLGQAIHSRYQEEARAADPTYQREVSVTLELVHRGWEVRIHGRIDGLRRDPDGALVVEEIKSVRRGGTLAQPVRELYERQALLYAWIRHRLGEENVRAELVLIEIGSDEIQREPLELRPGAVEGTLRRRLNSLLLTFESERLALDRRRMAATTLEFPHPELRPGQEHIVRAVETALAQGDQLLVEAPTGIGKTVAALYPALRYALENEKRVFVLTAKTLQQEMANRVLELLNPEGEFHSLQLRAKAKMCANDQLVCHEEYCSYARDYYAKLHASGVVDRLLAGAGTLLPDDVFAFSRHEEVCPFEVSLELASKVQVVVCDYNYAFDPYVALHQFGQEGDLDDTILIIDEVHNLVGRGRGYFSPALFAAAARRAGEEAATTREEVHQRIAGLCAELASLIERWVSGALEDQEAGVEALEAPLPEDDLWLLRPAFDEAFIDYLEYRRETTSFRPDDRFVKLYFDLLRFLNGLVWSENDAFSRCVESVGGNASLKILCKDPSRFLGRVLGRCHTVIGLSATLSPTEFYRDLLGFDPDRFDLLQVPSPFPEEHRRVVVDGTVSTLWRERPENYPRIARRLGEFADGVPGNCLALFPSYRFLDEVAERLQPQRKRVLVQTSSGTDRERQDLLDTLRGALTGDILLLAVAGGVFAEGVDYPGDMLKAVAVVGPCLPALNLEQELLKRYYEERFERGFEYSFVVPGMTRVVQAAGRLIRSASDTGVIALFDKRFLRSPYRDHLPADWLPAAGVEALEGEPARAATEFFRG